MGLPGWYLFLQVLFPAAIGIGGGLIAWAQWRTANQKVVLDLFERRFRLYHAARKLNREVIGAGKSATEQMIEMAELAREAKFLFGPEVASALDRASDVMIEIEVAEKQAKSMPLEAFRTLSRIQQALPELFLPYMRLDSKTIRSPRQWFRDASAGRKTERD